jgi:hypothetical protein
VIDGFSRRVSLETVDAVADDVVGAEPLARSRVLTLVINPRNSMRPTFDVGHDRVDGVAVATLRRFSPRSNTAGETARLELEQLDGLVDQGKDFLLVDAHRMAKDLT